jgi:hypothetical protein
MTGVRVIERLLDESKRRFPLQNSPGDLNTHFITQGGETLEFGGEPVDVREGNPSSEGAPTEQLM